MKRAGLTIMWVQSALSHSRKASRYNQAHVPVTIKVAIGTHHRIMP